MVETLVPVADVKLDHRTVKRIREAANIRERQGQATTEARILALLDIRLVYKVACGWMAFAGQNSAEYKWNMDCTMLFIVGEGHGRKVFVYREVGNKDKVETLANNDTAIGIKIVALGSAGGEIDRLVSVIAVKEMEEGTFVKQTVAGFTHSASGGDRDGTVYFCKTRGGCSALWQDVFLTFVIPTIKSSADHYKHKVRRVILSVVVVLCYFRF